MKDRIDILDSGLKNPAERLGLCACRVLRQTSIVPSLRKDVLGIFASPIKPGNALTPGRIDGPKLPRGRHDVPETRACRSYQQHSDRSNPTRVRRGALGAPLRDAGCIPAALALTRCGSTTCPRGLRNAAVSTARIDHNRWVYRLTATRQSRQVVNRLTPIVLETTRIP